MKEQLADQHVKDLPRDADGILRITDQTLGGVIESIMGMAPRLDVVAQSRLSPPLPERLAGLLSNEGDVLERCTGYRLGKIELSRNLAYVDLSRVEPSVAARLESGALHLGQLFTDERIRKFGWEWGCVDDAGDLDRQLRIGFDDAGGRFGDYVWRRYLASTGPEPAFVVIESLPTQTWDRLLASEVERLRLRELAE